MKCDICGGTTRIQRGQRYHYVESGLTNVYLENIELRICDSCKAVSPRIPRINELHATIGRAIALQQVPLAGKEVRFLRQHLGLKAREWAALLRLDAATLSRWENSEQQIGAQSDALLRCTYFLKLAEAGEKIPDRVVEQLASIVELRTDALAMLVNMNNPSVFSWRIASELLAA